MRLGKLPRKSGGAAPTLVVLMCCHNRRNLTLRALSCVYRQQTTSPLLVAVVLVDDGSTDGTREAVLDYYPEVEVVTADGQLYWSRSMALAQAVATADRQPDFLLWLNDDVHLQESAFQDLIAECGTRNHRNIVVGALRDPQDHSVTYSGFRRGKSKRPLDIVQLQPSEAAQDIATFNGNLVLVPRAVYQAVGGVDEVFRHGIGDIDYGYRASVLGYESVLLGGSLGTCSRNSSMGSWRDESLPFHSRLELLLSPKGMDPRTQAALLRRHMGRAWGAYYVAAYIRLIWYLGWTSARYRLKH